MYRLIEEMYRMIRRKITYTSTNFKFFSFPQHPGVSVVKCQQAWYFYTSTSCCAVLSSSAYFSPLFLMKKWQVHVISLRMCPTTVKQLFRCIAMAYVLVVYVVLLTKCLKRLTNTRTPCALVHMMAARTAFHYELVTCMGYICIPL